MMKIEIWSDIMCPFCYVGKSNLDEALKLYERKNDIELIWKSYLLDESVPEFVNESYVGYLSKKINISESEGYKMLEKVKKMGEDAGLHINFEKIIMTSSYKAHRLIQFAMSKEKGNEIERLLFEAFFTEGKNISDSNTLIRLAENVGLHMDEVKDAFDNDNYAYNIDNDINEARSIGVNSVPYYVLDRKFAISGAKLPQEFLYYINKVFPNWKME